ncbi:hypothetical protein D3C78_1392860 [compost metagenome]
MRTLLAALLGNHVQVVEHASVNFVTFRLVLGDQVEQIAVAEHRWVYPQHADVVPVAHHAALNVRSSFCLIHATDRYCFACFVLLNGDVELHNVVDEVVLCGDVQEQWFLRRVTHVRSVVQAELFKQVQCKAGFKVVLQCPHQNELTTTEAVLVATHSVNALPARTKHTSGR